MANIVFPCNEIEFHGSLDTVLTQFFTVLDCSMVFSKYWDLSGMPEKRGFEHY